MITNIAIKTQVSKDTAAALCSEDAEECPLLAVGVAQIGVDAKILHLRVARARTTIPLKVRTKRVPVTHTDKKPPLNHTSRSPSPQPNKNLIHSSVWRTMQLWRCVRTLTGHERDSRNLSWLADSNRPPSLTIVCFRRMDCSRTQPFLSLLPMDEALCQRLYWRIPTTRKRQ